MTDHVVTRRAFGRAALVAGLATAVAATSPPPRAVARQYGGLYQPVATAFHRLKLPAGTYQIDGGSVGIPADALAAQLRLTNVSSVPVYLHPTINDRESGIYARPGDSDTAILRVGGEFGNVLWVSTADDRRVPLDLYVALTGLVVPFN